jgi:hypothetical protein
LLAVLSIILWHLYHVLVRTFNRSMFSGYLTREQMEHEHPLALHPAPPPSLDEAKLARRKKQFWIGYGIAATLWLAGIAWFVTSEQTATTSVPPAHDLESYVPLPAAPPLQPAPNPEAAARYGSTWEGGIGGLFAEKCGNCHYPGGEAGLDLTSRGGASLGGESGAAVVAGAPGISLVLLWARFADHPGTWSPLEEAAVWDWIAAGAP